MKPGFLRAVCLLGAAALLAGAALTPERAWANLLAVSFFLTGLGLAGAFFVALQYASGAGWSVAFRRVPEAMSAALPFGAAGLAAVFLFAPSIYPWTGHDVHLHGAFKQFWLSRPFFLVRAAGYLLLWILLARAIVRTSRRQDVDGSVERTHQNVRLSVVFLVAFALTFWLAAFDWIMSLEPDWVSTIFGIYNFAGLFSSGLAALILLTLWQRRRGALREFVNEEHLHDLGKLLFAFSTFWMYIWFSQYMLIWYANITEESAYYVRRLDGAWGPLFLANMFLNWAIPFALLLRRDAKRSPSTMAQAAVVVLAGRWVDLHLMIAPPVAGNGPVFGLAEIGSVAVGFGLFVFGFGRAIGQAAPVPVRDPLLVESLHYHN